MIDDRISRIDKLLNNDSLLNEYISMIENSNFGIPEGLDKKVLSFVYEQDKKIIKKSNKFVDILKIVACTVVALCIWNSTLTSNTSYATSKSIKRSEFYVKFDSVMEDISNFFMTPIIFERGEK